jgi:hypothetical protein
MKLIVGLLLLGMISSLEQSQKQLDLRHSSGLESQSQLEAGQGSKYDNKENTRPKFPSDRNGTFFSGVFSDHLVLQRAPSKAAVYGVVFGAQASTNVSVTVSTVTETDEGYELQSTYAVVAHVSIGEHGYAKWKAFLQPTIAGGNYTITAECGSCSAPENSSTLVDVTFGVSSCNDCLSMP